MLKHAHVEKAGKHGVRWLRSKHAGAILALISFAESVFAPILIDPFLVALILANRAKWFYYTVISVVFSVLGGLAGYAIGYLLFDTVGRAILEFFNLTEEFANVAGSIDANAFVFVLIGAITPIPYKLVAIASGLASMDVLVFLIASIFGRIIRLGLVGYVAYAVGPHALPVFRKHLLTLAYIFFILLVAYLFAQWW
jgi:membrane protein YqaA with SNARE-associated domain